MTEPIIPEGAPLPEARTHYTQKDLYDIAELALVDHAISDVLNLICPPGAGHAIRELAATSEAIRALNNLTNQIDVLKRSIQDRPLQATEPRS